MRVDGDTIFAVGALVFGYFILGLITATRTTAAGRSRPASLKCSPEAGRPLTSGIDEPKRKGTRKRRRVSPAASSCFHPPR
jgi:hypothetical protein